MRGSCGRQPVLSAGLLELPFPLAGPLPPWRSVFAWFGLVPLLWAILSRPRNRAPAPAAARLSAGLSLRIALVLRQLLLDPRHDDAVRRHAAVAPALLLIGFSLVLGLYFGLFGLGRGAGAAGDGQHASGAGRAPFLWAALELAAARITSVPWDQLGYSQVDNVIGEPARALDRRVWDQLCSGRGERADCRRLLARSAARAAAGAGAVAGVVCLCWRLGGGSLSAPPAASTCGDRRPDSAESRCGRRERWAWPGRVGPAYRRICPAWRTSNARPTSRGFRRPGAANGEIVCPPYPTHPDLVVWPESPAPFC